MCGINSRLSFVVLFLIGSIVLSPFDAAATETRAAKIRVLIVGSYHQDDAQSQDALRGFSASMKSFGYFDNDGQAADLLKNNYLETTRVIAKLLWLDARRKSTKSEIEGNASAIYSAAKEFNPGIVILADEFAGNYIGRLYLNSKTPVVFWGFNDTPVKFGLVDTANKPGHNITGIYQLTTDVDNLRTLLKINGNIKSIAILADDSPSSQAHVREVKNIAQKGLLPIELVDFFVANDYAQWKSKVLELQKKVAAFYVVGFANLKDVQGKIVPEEDVAEWYLENSTRPEATLGYMVKMGLLCSADDTAYKQGYEAGSIVHDILSKGANPATLATRSPAIQEAFMLNAKRLQTLRYARKTKWGHVQEFDRDKMELQEMD